MLGRKIRNYLVVGMALGMVVLSGCGADKKSETTQEQDNRTVLTLENYNYNTLSSQISQYVDAFNQTNDTYRIEIRDYAENEDCDTAFGLDMSAGKTPDIIVTDRSRLDRLIHTGLLTDMQSYLDADEELDRDDFMESVMSAWLQDDKLYYMALDYYINVLFGKEQTVGQFQNGWTKEEMIAFAEKTEVPLFYENDKMTMFDQFFVCGYSEFVDWDTGKADFDSALFRRILQYCDRGVKNSDRLPTGQEWIDEFKDDKYILSSGSFQHFSDIEQFTRIFGQDLCYIGFPNAYGDSSYMNFQDCIGISSKSEYQDAAWSFIRSMFTKDAQYTFCQQTRWLSVRKDIFAMQKQAAMATEPYTDAYGTQIEPIISSPDLIYDSLSQEEADLVEQLVLGAKHCWKVDHNIGDIIYDEVSAYFNGDCSIDRVGETINSRVETYMSENQ